MRMRRFAPLMLLVSCGVAAWALKVGDEAPPLTVKAVNHDGDAYDIIKASGGSCGIVFAKPEALTEDNPAKLAAALNEIYKLIKKDHEDKAWAVLVLVGDGDAESAKEFAKKAGLDVPVAVISPKDEALAKWELPADLKASFMSVEGGKIESQYDDADKLMADLEKMAKEIETTK